MVSSFEPNSLSPSEEDCKDYSPCLEEIDDMEIKCLVKDETTPRTDESIRKNSVEDYEESTQILVEVCVPNGVHKYEDESSQSGAVEGDRISICDIFSCNAQMIGLAFSLLNALSKGTASSLIKLSTLPSSMLATYQAAIQILFCLPFIIYKKENIFGRKEDRFYLLLHCLCSLDLIASIFAFNYIPVGEATAIIFSGPLFTMIFARIFLKEPFGKYELVAAVGTLSGVVAVVNPNKIITDIHSGTFQDQIIGCSCALGTALLMASWATVLRKLKHVTWSVLTFWAGIGMMAYSLILNGLFNTFTVPDTLENAAVSFGSVVMAVIANLFFILALHYAQAGYVVVGKSTEVIFAALYQIFLFKDDITLTTAAGMVLICFSVIFLNSKNFILDNIFKKVKFILGNVEKKIKNEVHPP